jgi:hypothetical protein
VDVGVREPLTVPVTDGVLDIDAVREIAVPVPVSVLEGVPELEAVCVTEAV